jgi:hypothetical protein
MSDGKSEESDGFFGIDDSAKKNENDVDVPVDKSIDDNDRFFADADDHNEGEENDDNKRNSGDAQDDNDSKKGEGAIGGQTSRCFIVVDLIVTVEKTMRRKEETRIRKQT